jgi:predicted ATPase
VQRQIAGLFVAEERGTHPLKGVPEPTALFRLVRASGAGRRSPARQLTPLVGRDEEMAMLMRRWQRVRQGDGQLVLIVGEPGLGKSRLIEELHARLRDTPHTWVEWSCAQLLQNTPLHPITEWGRQRFGGAEVPAERRLGDLESSLAQVKLPAEIMALVAPLLDIPLPADRAPTLSPEELRRRQLAALTNWVIAGARIQPVVLAFEDLHWSDPTTIDLLRGIAERGAAAPLFVVATTRPEFRPSWSMRSHHGTVSLGPLDPADARHMVAQLAARHALARQVVDDVAARTGGVPLFVEEVTRLLLERGERGGIQAIPPTLQQSLMARLDRLGPAREVAQVSSVIGRGFSYALLRALSGMEDEPLQVALDRLAAADILLVQGLPPNSDYRFKHALIQDAAYENLLKKRRQTLHRRIAEILLDGMTATAAAEPEALAHHFTQAGMTDVAIEWWGKAGDHALRRSAFQEAISHLGKAIEMEDKFAEGAPRAAAATGTEEAKTAAAARQSRLKLQVSYGQAMLHARGYSAPETTAAFARARELAASVEDPSERFSIYFGLWAGSFVRGELTPLREFAAIMLRECEARSESQEACTAVRSSGNTNWFAGDFVEARVQLERALAMFNPAPGGDLAIRFAQDVGVAIMMFLTYVLWPLGEVDGARKVVDETATRVKHVDHIGTTVYFINGRALFEMMRRNPAAAAFDAEMVIDLTRKHQLPMFAVWGAFIGAWSRRHVEGASAGLEEMRNGIAACRAQGNGLFMPLLATTLAEAEAEAGEIEAALATIDGVIAETERNGQRWFEAETYRIRGEILLKRDPANTAPAEEALLAATTIAQQQKARSFELRAAISRAKLYLMTGRPAYTRAVLEPALEGFSPTPEFPEIGQAQSLLAAIKL